MIRYLIGRISQGLVVIVGVTATQTVGWGECVADFQAGSSFVVMLVLDSGSPRAALSKIQQPVHHMAATRSPPLVVI